MGLICKTLCRGADQEQERQIIFMEENKNTNVDTQTGDGAQATTNGEKSTDKVVTMSQIDFDKAIQSAEDRVRGKMSKTIKELQEKVKELTPVEKTQDQIDLENRIAALEKSEREVAAQKKRLDIQEQLSGKGIDKSMVDFLRADADLEAFSDLIDTITKTRMKSSGYVPGEHTSDDKITPEDFKKMTYSEKVNFSQAHPEAYKRFMGSK